MQTCDVCRYLVMIIRENCAAVKYSDDGRRLDISGAWGDKVDFDDLRTLARCNSAIFRGWEAGINGPDGCADVERLERKAADALKKARSIIEAWGTSPAGGRCEIDVQSAADAGALVLVCFDAGGVSRRVDLSAFFGRH